MTAQCVNKNTSEFKTLAAVLGDAQAEGLSIQNNYVTPSVDDAFKMIKGNKLNQFKNAVSHVTKLSVADPEVLVSGFGKIIQKFNNRFFVVKGSKISEVPTEAARTHVEQRNLSFINFLNDKLGKIFNISSVSNIPAGKQLFSEPNPETKILSNQYKKEKGITTPSGSRFNIIDVDRAKRIANAFEAMKNEPNNTTVKAAYEQMAKETIDQFNTLVNAGYKVEIYEGIGEPYSNSQAMINDVRNKHQYILSTEKDFGTTSITDEDRKNNPLLRDSGLKDANGKTLLINDLFRSVHDFFGHTERGNAFGPIGEENAWDVHARMFTPLARRAMTSETRGQNSFVNFGPHMRNEKGDIIKKGEPGYLDPKQRPYADQKIGLLPEEFSNLDMPDINSITGTEPLVAGQALPTRFQQDQPTGHVEESLATARESNKGIGSRYLTDAIYYADGRVKGPASIPNQVVLPYSNKLLATKLKKLKESIRNMPAGEKKQKALDKMFTLADQAYSEFKTVLKNNLRGIYDAWDPELIKRSKHWYEGANRIAQTLANQYGLSVEVSSGIIAVLSPQNEWFNNINGAYRVMDVMKNFSDKPVTAEMFDKVADYVQGEPFELIMSGLRTKYEGKTFNDATSDMDKANMLRVIDTAVHTEEVPTVSPEGAITGIKATGPFATRFAWGSTSEIFKAISIFSDPSLENVSKRLGKGNKVRNFYNNIVNPNSPNGEVTADTHALGAGLLNIVAAEDSSSMGLFRNDTNGNSPLYATLKESYQELAKEKGLLPRELQSIVWEATRLLIHESDKTLDNRTFTNDIWQQVQQNKLTQDEAIKQIIGHFKFIRPEWAGSTEQGGSTDVLQGTEYSLYEGGSIRSDIRRQPGDTGANTANVVDTNDLKDTKVVDEQGKPAIVYHGTNAEFESFDKSKSGSKNFFADSAYEGIFFAGNPETSKAYLGINTSDIAGMAIGGHKILKDAEDKYKNELDSVNVKINKVKDEQQQLWNDKWENSSVGKWAKEHKLTDKQIQELKYIDPTWQDWYNNAFDISTEKGYYKELEEVKQRMLTDIEGQYITEKGLKPRIVQANLNIKNPYVFDYAGAGSDTEGLTHHIKQAKKNGNDGVIFKNLADGAEIDTIYVAFDPAQVKIIGALDKTGEEIQGPKVADGTYEVKVNQEALNKLVEKNRTNPAEVPFEGAIPGERYQKTSDTEAFWDNENAKRLAVSDIVGFLNSKYNIPFEYDTTMEVAAKFSGGKIFLNPNKIGLDSPFHEIAHPFVALMEKTHPDLYNSLIAELSNEEGQRELTRVKAQYPELSEKEQKDEALVSLIGKMSGQFYAQAKMSDAQRSLFQRIVDFLKGVLHSLGFNSRDFTPGMSMREVAHLLVNPYYKYDFEANQRKVNLEQEYNQKASDADAVAKFNTYVDNIIIRLRNDSKLKGKTDDENFRKYISGKLADDIEKNRNDLETLNKFTDAALFNMLDLNRKADALREKYVAKKDKSKEDIAEMMHLLQQIDDHVAIYSDAANLIDVIKIIYPDDLEDENGEEKEPVDLRYSLETQHRLVEHYKDWATDAIADWLMPYYTKAINNAMNGGDITRAIPKELYNKTKLQLNNQKITDPKIIATAAAKQHIKNELLTAGNDTGFVTALFRGVLNVKDPIAQLVGLAITDVITKGLEKGRVASKKLGQLLKAKVGLKVFTTNNDWKELYKPFLRTVKVWTYKGLGKDANKEYEYREHVAFHEEYRWDEFYDAKRLADEKRGPRPAKTDTAAFAKWYADRNAWLAANTIFVKNPKGTELEDSVAAWNDYNIRKQAADDARGIRPAKKNKAELAKWKADREAWLTANPSPINNPSLKGGRLPSAAFKNAEWLTLQSDPFFKELYTSYKESNDRLGLAGLRYGIVPQKELGGVSAPKKVPTAKGTAEALREFVGENEQIYYAQEIDGSERKSPKPYFTHLLDKDQDLDYNLTDVVSKFTASSHRFHELSQVEEHVKILKNFIGGSHNLNIDKRQTYKKTTAGLSAFFKGQHVPVKGEAEHVNAQLLNFINDTCYGEGLKQDVVQLWDSKFQVTKKGETTPTVVNGFEDLVQHTGLHNLDYKGFEFMKDRTVGDWTIRMVKKDWNFSVKKTANKLGLLTALSTMVFNPTAAVVNLVRAKIEQFVEGVGGKYFSLKDASIGEAEYFKALGSGDFFDDLLRDKPSFLSSMLISYDAIQGELQDIDGHKIDAGVANKLFRRNHLYFLQNGGEHQAQTSLMISMMNHQKIKTNSGETLSLYHARKLEYGGSLKMSDTNWTDEQDRGFKETLKFVNKTLNGNYDKLDKAGIQRRWWGSLLMMFKKHIPNMIINRYGKGYVHLESGQWTQGYYRTIFEGVVNQLGSYILNKKISQASWGAEQNYAARKLGADLFIVALLIIAFKAFDDDDKDDDLSDWGALAARRLISESGQYTPYLLPSELARIVSQPFASTSTVKAFSDAIAQTISDPHDVYQRSGSGYKAGENKAAVKWGRAIPIYKVTKYGQFERLLDYYRLNSRGLDWLKPSAGQQTEE